MASSSPDPAWLAPAQQIVSEFEGCKLKAYPDPGTGGEPWTIGWGTTVYYDGTPVKKGQKISQGLADDLLRGRLEVDGRQLAQIIPGWEKLTPNQQAALVSFTYNVGPNWFEGEGFTTISRYLREGKLELISQALMLYVNPGSPVEEGLKRRRKAEGALWNTGLGISNSAPPRETPAPSNSPIWPKGMVGPKIRPDLQPGDHHLIANDINETITAYTPSGVKLWTVPCLCRGQGGEAEWSRTAEDTPPGLYRINKLGIYKDYETHPNPGYYTQNRKAYGWYSFDLIGLEGQEGPDSKPYRDGIMIHGGGSACGWPSAWAPRQPLFPTLGCIRMHNQDLQARILPLLTLGNVYVSVLQEAPPGQS